MNGLIFAAAVVIFTGALALAVYAIYLRKGARFNRLICAFF